MINPKLQTAINSQINQEYAASYSYLQMSAYFEAENLDGFAHWMYLQHQEEQVHGYKLITYLHDRGGKLELESIAKPKLNFDSTLDAFKMALSYEQENTLAINNLYALAKELNDYATQSHLQWFIDEQVEEEKSIEDIITVLEKIGDDVTAMLYLNDKLAARQAEGASE